MKYQAGAMYQTGYINIYGIPIDSYGMHWVARCLYAATKVYTNISVEAGQQGSLQKMLVRESYLKLNCSFNLWERWFNASGVMIDANRSVIKCRTIFAVFSIGKKHIAVIRHNFIGFSAAGMVHMPRQLYQDSFQYNLLIRCCPRWS